MSDFSDNGAFVDDSDIYGKNIKTVPKPKNNIGIDTENKMIDDLSSVVGSQSIDMAELEKFTTLSGDRNQLYSLIDQMGADAILSAALETYAEDCTERNPQGKIVWAESADSDTAKYIGFLLDQLNIDKNVYKWVYSLCKYGDLYIRLYRESEVEDDLFSNTKYENDVKKKLNEDVKVKAFSKNDKFIHYVEAVPNPAEMFELTKYGISYAYIDAPSPMAANYDYTGEEAWLTNAQNKYIYQFKKSDVTIYPPTEFVHACLEDATDRFPEMVDIFNDAETLESDDEAAKLSYKVRRGSSLLKNIFKVWRELQLLQNSVLLNRVTKSSIVRLIQVEVNDMPKERVRPHLDQIKSLIEQKSAIKTGTKMSEYTNPGPIENNVYVPTRNGQGSITTSQIGGDVDVKSLADLEYYRDLLFGNLRIPKQFLGFTDDATGFNGGTSLSLISSRYAKMIKRIQTTISQAVTDIINILLQDKGQTKYINKFSIHMVEPMTEEEKNRQENMSSEIQIVSDTMSLIDGIEDQSIKLQILKSLLSGVITNSEVVDLIQQSIDQLEEQNAENGDVDAEDDEDVEIDFGGGSSGGRRPRPSSSINDLAGPSEPSGGGSEQQTFDQESPGEAAGELPSMNDLGLDFADSTQF